MGFLLAGLATGLGDGLQDLAQRRREVAEALLEEQQSARSSGGGSGGGSGSGGSPRAITRGLTGNIRSWAEQQGLDEGVISAFVTETERILGQNPTWTENMAWQHVQQHANRGDREVVEGSGWFDGPERTVLVPGEGPFDGTFTYPNQQGAGQGGSAPAGTTGSGQGASGGAGTTGQGGASPTAGAGGTTGTGAPAAGSGQPAGAQPSGFGGALGLPERQPEAQPSGTDYLPVQTRRTGAGTPPATPAPAAPAQGAGQPAMPQVGDVIDGYRYIGGNPADRNSWERVSQ